MVIALTGFSRSGKGEVSKYLQDELGFYELNFADPLKEGVSALFGWDLDSMYDQKAKATVDPLWGITPRTALQLVGTDIMREFFSKVPGWKAGQDFWLHRFEQEYSKLSAEGVDVVVSDARFPNEIELIKRLGGQVYMVQRDSVTPPDLSVVHASERVDLLTGLTGTIPNNGSLDDLRNFLSFGDVLKIALVDGQWVADE